MPDRDPIDSARGILIGLLLSIPFWGGIWLIATEGVLAFAYVFLVAAPVVLVAVVIRERVLARRMRRDVQRRAEALVRVRAGGGFQR